MNNNLLNKALKKISKSPKKCEYYKNSIVFEDENNKYVLKKNNDIANLYHYLHSRGFDYLPDLEYLEDNFYIYKYVNDTLMPKEQKISDLIKLMSLLHNKTVYHKDISVDDVKSIYESLKNKIEVTSNFYENKITKIEEDVFMSPSSYALARNYSYIFNCIEFCKKELDDWYDLMKDVNKTRVSLIHNNLDTDHLIKNSKDVLISWDKAYHDSPIYDFIKIYKKYYDKYDFNNLYHEYTKRFPLLAEEKKLLFINLFIPDIIDFNNSDIKNTYNVVKLCNYLVITNDLFMKNEAKNTKEKNNNINE